MKILFIQNNGVQESLGIANISGMLKSGGHDCDVVLMTHTRDLEAEIRRINPQLIALSALTGVHHSLLALARRIKQSFDIPIIMGGPHPTYSPEVILEPGIDIICRGEGEEAFLELADHLQSGKDITRIRNLHVKTTAGVIHKNDMRPPTANLDDLPMPDREIYYKYTFLRDMTMKRFMSSMGCPYPCTFCHEPVIRGMYRGKGNYVRRKSVRRIMDEVKYIRDRYPLNHVYFADDLFFIRNCYEWLEEFAEVYRQEIRLPFACNLRYDSVNEHAADLLARAGCYGVSFGLESGNETIREIVIKKKVSNDDMVRGAQLLRERGIVTNTTNVIGLPGETIDQAFETVELNMRLKTKFARANTFLLFPGLPMVDYAVHNGYVEEGFDIDKHVAESTEINLKTPYKKEFRNLASLFWVFAKFSPAWIPFFKWLVRWPDNIVFRLVGYLNMVQELLYYRISPVAGFKFYANTVLKTGEMTMRNIPQLMKKPEAKPEEKLVFESSRGYL